MRRIPLLLVVLSLAAPASAGEPKLAAAMLRTSGGVPFGMLGAIPKAPAPTLFIFANSVRDTLGNDAYCKVGRLLLKQGVLSVAVDVPGHGDDQRKGEPGGLVSWRKRLEKKEDFVGDFTTRCRAVLDHLVKEGITDPEKVAACGTSRGGYAAFCFAAVEPRVKWVAAFAPVTNPLALSEFAGLEDDPAARALALVHKADRLGGRAVWLCIGNNDRRVSTDDAIALTRRLVQEAIARKTVPHIDLVVTATPGHTIHATAHDEAAAWLAKHLLVK